MAEGVGRELPKVRGVGGVEEHVCAGQRGPGACVRLSVYAWLSVRDCLCVARVLPNYLFMKKSHVRRCV